MILTFSGLVVLAWAVGVACGLGIAAGILAMGRQSWRRDRVEPMGVVSAAHLQTLQSEDAKK